MRYQWIVEMFNYETLFGIVSSKNRKIKFHSTSFQSDSSLRFPFVGESVEVVFNGQGNLLSIHGK